MGWNCAGALLAGGANLATARAWPAQTEVTVAEAHFIQEDSPDEIGRPIDILTMVFAEAALFLKVMAGFREHLERPQVPILLKLFNDHGSKIHALPVGAD